MANWPALLLAPMLALTDAAVAYALVTPSCSRQDHAGLHALFAFSLLACLVMTWPAARNWLRWRTAGAPSGPAAGSRRKFVAQVATMAGLLSALVMLAEWLPVWILSPCAA
ncbi:MAG: hypothetical protein JWR65_5004 [Massilia sp.]|jgi:hypothetical protein|nr:hypothetical protein [Massilia sp.]